MNFDDRFTNEGQGIYFDQYHNELVPIDGFHVESVAWDNNILTDIIRLTAHNSSKTLVFKYLQSCCEHNYFVTKYLADLVGEVIISIDVEEDRDYGVEIIDMKDEEDGYDKSSIDRAEYIDGKLRFYQITNKVFSDKVYAIKTQSGKEILLPLITISNGYYTGILFWKFE